MTGRRRLLRASLLTGVVALGASVLLAPAAWAEYLRVLPNLFAGDATQATNLSPWAMSLTLGAPPSFAGALRAASLLVAVGCALAAARVAMRPDGLQAGVVLGTVAMLLLPAQLWYHYLAVLLPLAALAWDRAGSRLRAGLVLTAATISVGIAWLPLATVGGALLVACLLAALWPGRSLRPGHIDSATAPASSPPA